MKMIKNLIKLIIISQIIMLSTISFVTLKLPLLLFTDSYSNEFRAVYLAITIAVIFVLHIIKYAAIDSEE